MFVPRTSTVFATSFLFMLVMPPAAKSAEKVTVTTHTYKRVGTLSIKADLHRVPDDKVRPVAVWIHGGALINGHRAGINGRFKRSVLRAGYALLSIDYRLAPETQLPEIIKDVEDAFSWLGKNAGKLKLDTDRLAVAGGSAGGYLTLVCGYRVQPQPKVLISFWGYGDLVGDWYSKPSKHPRHNRFKPKRETAYKQVSGPPISDSRLRKGRGGIFYIYCRQHGLWPKAVSGWDPHKEAEKFFPYMPVKNVTRRYPPTMLIHGTKDTDVPYRQSTMMAEQFKKHKVKHKLVTIKNGEHGLGGGDREKINAAYRGVLPFMDKFIKR